MMNSINISNNSNASQNIVQKLPLGHRYQDIDQFLVRQLILKTNCDQMRSQGRYNFLKYAVSNFIHQINKPLPSLRSFWHDSLIIFPAIDICLMVIAYNIV